MITRNENRVLVIGGIILLICLFLPFKFGYDDELIQRVFDVLHLPLFFLLTAYIARHLKSLRPSLAAKATSLATLLAIELNALIELIQPLTGRSQSAQDFYNGLIGSLLYVFAVQVNRASRPALANTFTATLCLICTLNALKPAYNIYELRTRRLGQMPILVDFSDPAQFSLWKSSDSAAPKSKLVLLNEKQGQTEHAKLLVATAPGHYSGAEFNAFGVDWNGYSDLQLTIEDEEAAPLSLYVRIDDSGDTTEADSRYNGELSLTPGMNMLKIPLSQVMHAKARELDLANITRILFFVGPTESSKQFAIHRIELTR